MYSLTALKIPRASRAIKKAKFGTINLFFDDYEEDKVVAEQADNMCLSCPVAKACLLDGEENNSYGVWGGLYLTSGKIDKNKNSHKFNSDGTKTDAMKRLEGIHGRSFKVRQNNG